LGELTRNEISDFFRSLLKPRTWNLGLSLSARFRRNGNEHIVGGRLKRVMPFQRVAMPQQFQGIRRSANSLAPLFF